jgi:hypothetical protein
MSGKVRISEVGLRGIVGSGLSAEHIVDFASAFGTFLGPGAVAVGRDPRASSVMLREGVIAGLLARSDRPRDGLDAGSATCNLPRFGCWRNFDRRQP